MIIEISRKSPANRLRLIEVDNRNEMYCIAVDESVASVSRERKADSLVYSKASLMARRSSPAGQLLSTSVKSQSRALFSSFSSPVLFSRDSFISSFSRVVRLSQRRMRQKEGHVTNTLARHYIASAQQLVG